MYQYETITIDEQNGIIVEQCPFESEHNDLDVDPHNNDNLPFALGSNQYIVSLDD